MVFSSINFVFVFLPAIMFCYFIAEKSGRMCLKNTVLLIFSLIFYAWGGGAIPIPTDGACGYKLYIRIAD